MNYMFLILQKWTLVLLYFWVYTLASFKCYKQGSCVDTKIFMYHKTMILFLLQKTSNIERKNERKKNIIFNVYDIIALIIKHIIWLSDFYPFISLLNEFYKKNLLIRKNFLFSTFLFLARLQKTIKICVNINISSCKNVINIWNQGFIATVITKKSLNYK